MYNIFIVWAFWKFTKFQVWNNRKIAFVSILTATSVSFILIFSMAFPIASLPSFKLTLGGLPIKITGYIFGPLIGLVVGLASDVISFFFRPTFIHYWYSLAFAMVGTIPGIVGYFFNRRWRSKKAVDTLFANKYIMSNYLITITFLVIILSTVTTLIVLQGDDFFAKQNLIRNKWVFLAISMFGITSMLVGMLLFRFILKPSTFNAIIPIVAFSAILEVINTPLLTAGDIASWGHSKDQFITILSGHLIITPAKIWVNLFVIYFAYKIVSPLIYNKTNNGW